MKALAILLAILAAYVVVDSNDLAADARADHHSDCAVPRAGDGVMRLNHTPPKGAGKVQHVTLTDKLLKGIDGLGNDKYGNPVGIRSPELAAASGVPAKSITALLATAVTKGRVVVCKITIPGATHAQNEYRKGGGLPPPRIQTAEHQARRDRPQHPGRTAHTQRRGGHGHPAAARQSPRDARFPEQHDTPAGGGQHRQRAIGPDLLR